MPLGPGVPSPATLLFNYPTGSIIPLVSRLPISIDKDDEQHKALVKRQTNMIEVMIFPEIILFFPRVYCSYPVGRW